MITPPGLVGGVVSDRISDVIKWSAGSRVLYAIVDLGPEMTSAIGRSVSNITPEYGRVEVAIHSDLAIEDLEPELRSDDVATRFRNRKDQDVVATVFSVPGQQIEEVIQSLGTVERIDESWLFSTVKADVWAAQTLPNYDMTIQNQLTGVLRGLMDSDILTSPQMLAEFCVEIRAAMTGPEGLPLVKAVNRALPCLRLPRDCALDTGPDVFAAKAAGLFRRLRDNLQPHFYLEPKRGDIRPQRELLARIRELKEMGTLEEDAVIALENLVRDRELAKGIWRESQQRVAELSWSKVRPFFDERAAKPSQGLGKETITFLEEEFPGELSNDEGELLEQLKSATDKPSPEYEDLFVRHRERLRTHPKLYKKWKRLIFNRPIEENDDLLLGLVRLAESAFQGADNVLDPVLLVKLRDAEKMSFWKSEKNADLCAYLRDRYRGLDRILKPCHVELRFGRCWEINWESQLDSKNRNERGSGSAEFEFEAYVVAKDQLATMESDKRRLGRLNKAQLIWRPGHSTFAVALSKDLRRVLPTPDGDAFLLRSSVLAARNARGSATMRATVDAVTSITDSLDGSQGALANSDDEWGRIDRDWLEKLDQHSEGVLMGEQQGELREAFHVFRQKYTSAIGAMTCDGGEGLSSPALVDQVKCFGLLLTKLRENAWSDILVREVWEPLLQIGTATVSGDSTAMIVAPWHPLRLFELAVKAHQAAQVIDRIATSSPSASAAVEEYVKDRLQALQGTYYANVGLVSSDVNAPPRMLVETEVRSGYSLLQPPFSLDSPEELVEEPVKHTVQRFGEIARNYLDQRPHDRANFSAVLLDTESEELPVLIANHLAKQIEDETDLRCDLLVTHVDSDKLRKIYDRQNRRIGHEIESSLTSEAARIFLSRLRVGIASPESLESHTATKRQDILLLYDVIARRARVTWHEAISLNGNQKLLEHIPTDISRRKSQSSGSLRSSVYLTSPSQIEPSQAYLDALHDVLVGTSQDVTRHFIPAQEVQLGSREISEKLKLAHQMANWVITYDRIADRRLISRADQDGRLRILRYFSSPRSIHNVIVSTELTQEYLYDRLREDIEEILPGQAEDTVSNLIYAIYDRSASLSGSIVMRGARWDNYAREFIGIIVAQRELELILSGSAGSPNRTVMFFLDEFKSWLDLSGKISDILAVNLYVSPDGPLLRLVVSEAKCVGEANLSESRTKSRSQLTETYTALCKRFVASDTTVDYLIWRNRLADMLIEHMDPWGERETLGDMRFDEWIISIRNGSIPIDVSGHSIVAVHDKPNSSPDFDHWTADTEKERAQRRKLAQWILGVDGIQKSLQGIAHSRCSPLFHEPKEWKLIPIPPIPGSTSPMPDGFSETSNDEQAKNESSDEAEKAANEIGGDGSSCLGEGEIIDLRREPMPQPELPAGWKPEVYAAVAEMKTTDDEQRRGKEWLDARVEYLKQALQAENMEAPVKGIRLTPNAGLVRVDGRAVRITWLEKRRIDLLTQYGIEIVRITPHPGYITVALKRPERKILHLSDAWTTRSLEEAAPERNLALVIGEQEDDGKLFYLSLENKFAGRERADPHTLISGTTGSGKGILVSNLILDICAFNDPRSVEVYLIDPKQGADYLWTPNLPHLREGIVTDMKSAVDLLNNLVCEMEDRYRRITQAGCPNIDQYNKKNSTTKIPRVIIFFDEVANWMQDDDFKREVERLINKIATKSRAAGLHLFMVYQRADNQVMTMQLRTNLGNKIILRLGDEGSSKIALGEKGAESLLGKGHVIAKLGTGEKIYGQVPFISPDEINNIATAVVAAWEKGSYEQDRNRGE